MLSGDIRYFRFFDGPGGASFVGIDNVEITAASVPEPSTLAILSIGLLGFGMMRQRRHNA